MSTLSHVQRLFFDKNKLKEDISFVDFHKSGLGCTSCKGLARFEKDGYIMDIEIKKHLHPQNYKSFKKKFIDKIKITNYNGKNKYKSGLTYDSFNATVKNQNVMVKAIFNNNNKQLERRRTYMVPNKGIYMTASLMKLYIEHMQINNLMEPFGYKWLSDIFNGTSMEITRYTKSSLKNKFILNNEHFILLPFHPKYIPIFEKEQNDNYYFETALYYDQLVDFEIKKEEIKEQIEENKKVDITKMKQIIRKNKNTKKRKQVCNEFVYKSEFVIFIKPDQNIYSIYDLEEDHIKMLENIKSSVHNWFNINYGVKCGFNVDNLYIYTIFPHQNTAILSFQVKYIDLTKQNPFTRIVDRARELSLDDIIMFLKNNGNMHKYFVKFYSGVDKILFKLAQQNLINTIYDKQFKDILESKELETLVAEYGEDNKIGAIIDKYNGILESKQLGKVYNFLSFIEDTSIYIFHHLFKLLYRDTDLHPFVTNYKNLLDETVEYAVRNKLNCDRILTKKYYDLDKGVNHLFDKNYKKEYGRSNEIDYLTFKKNVEIKKIFLDVTRGKGLFCTFSVICEIDKKQYIVNFTNTDVNNLFMLQYSVNKKEQLEGKIKNIIKQIRNKQIFIDELEKKLETVENKAWDTRDEYLFEQVEEIKKEIKGEKERLKIMRNEMEQLKGAIIRLGVNKGGYQTKMKKYFDFNVIDYIITGDDLLMYGIMNNVSQYNIDICMLPLKRLQTDETYVFDNFNQWRKKTKYTQLFTDVTFSNDKVRTFVEREGYHETMDEYNKYKNIYDTYGNFKCKAPLDLKSSCVNIFQFILYKYIDQLGDNNVTKNVRTQIEKLQGYHDYIFIGPHNLPYIAFPDKALTDDILKNPVHYVDDNNFDYVIWYVHKETWEKSLNIKNYMSGETLENYLKSPDFKLSEINKQKICKVTDGKITYPHTIRNVTVKQLDQLYMFINWFKKEIHNRKPFRNLSRNNLSMPYFHYPIVLSQSTLHLHIKSKKKTKYVRHISTNYLDVLENARSTNIDTIYYQKVTKIKPPRFSFKKYTKIHNLKC